MMSFFGGRETLTREEEGEGNMSMEIQKQISCCKNRVM